MKWNDYIDIGPPPKTARIPVRRLGIAKVVRVQTKANGDIKPRKIEVK